MQNTNPVYVNDSPESAELLGRLDDHYRSGHVSEAVRLCQELLDRYPMRLVLLEPDEAETESEDGVPLNSERFDSVRRRVHATLRSHPDLLTAYQATQNAVATAAITAGNHESVFRSRALTTPGLTAGLLIARDHVLNARFHAALRVLRELAAHPDFTEESTHLDGEARRRCERTWCLLTMMAGRYGDVASARNDAERAWETWGFDGTAAQALEQLDFGQPDIESLPRTDQATGRSTTSAAYGHDQPGADRLIHTPDLTRMSLRPVWRSRLDTTLTTALASPRLSESQRRNLKVGSDSGQYLGVFPVVRDDVIVVNDGVSVTVFDRYDGSRRWVYNPSLGDMTVSTLSMVHTGPWDSVTVSPRTAVLHGNATICIIWNGDGNLAQAQSSRLVNLDLDTGGVRWSVLPGALDPGFEFAGFIGTPTVAEGVLYVVVRTLGQQLGSDYLLAIDPETGSLVWQQYLVSSAVGRGWSWLPATNPVCCDGQVTVSSPLGVVGTYDGATGEPQWVRTMPTSPDRFRFEESRPWAFDVPLFTEAGIVTFTPDRQRVALLEAGTGALLGDVAAMTIGDPSYLLSDGRWVYAVGHVVVGFAADRIRDDADDLLMADRVSSIPTPVGRAMVVGRAEQLIVPTLDGLYLIDVSERDVVESSDPVAWGNPLVIGAEVILCTTDGIDSYMPFEVGQPILMAKSAARPADPMPAISLAALAFQHRRLDRIAPAVDEAIERISADPFDPAIRTARSRLMTRLLNIVQNLDVSVPAGQRTAAGLFIRLDLLAAAPDERVAYLMEYGSHLENLNRPREAIEAFQQITLSPELAESYWQADAGSVQARIEARRRIRNVLTDSGRESYAAFDEQAAAAFDRVQAQGPDTVDSLLALADRYPAAGIIPQLHLEAGRQLREQGHAGLAIAQWRLGLEFDSGNNDDVRPMLLGELLSLLRATERYREALFELELLLQEDPFGLALDPMTGRTASLETWKPALEADLASSAPAAVVGAFVTSLPALEARCDELLLPVYGDPLSSAALIRQGRVLHAVGGPDFQPLWSRALARPDVHVLHVDHRSQTALLWYWESRAHTAVERISTVNGQQMWLQDDLGDAAAQWDRSGGRANQQLDPPTTNWSQSGTKYGQPELVPALGDGCVMLATEAGRVLCLETETGTPRWDRQYDASLVTHIEAHAGIVAVALVRQTDATALPAADDDRAGNNRNEPAFGVQGVGPANGRAQNRPTARADELLALSAHMLLIDQRTGDVTVDLKLPDSQLVQWVDIGPAGELIYASESAIYCYDTYRHEQRWRVDDPALAGTRWPMSEAGMLMLTDLDDSLVRLDYQTGRHSRIGDIRVAERRDTFPKLLAYRDQHVLKTGTGVYMLHADGTIIGRLSRSESEDLYIVGVAPTADRITVLQRHNMLTESGVPDRHASLYHVDRSGRRISDEVEPDGTVLFPGSDAIQAINDWIVVDAGQRVLAFSCPADETSVQ
ncbi:MAG: hypothetical protein D8M59_00655 [Planctomycetes bacterium]|nr:hypothetical protein [Planctomycetota bacterium]